MDWQPIETAPARGRFLAYNAMTGPYVTERFFQDGAEHFPLGWWGQFGEWYPRPTHWAPLPPMAPPSGAPSPQPRQEP